MIIAFHRYIPPMKFHFAKKFLLLNGNKQIQEENIRYHNIVLDALFNEEIESTK